MNETEKKIIDVHEHISSIVKKCITTERFIERASYGKYVLKKIKESEEHTLKAAKACEELIDSLGNAAKTISEQNEWLNCLYAAMGENKDEIIKLASVAQKVLKDYKNKINRKD